MESPWALVIYPKDSLIAKIPIFISKSGSIGKCVKNRAKYFLQKNLQTFPGLRVQLRNSENLKVHFKGAMFKKNVREEFFEVRLPN